MFNVEDIRENFPILSTQVYGNPLVYLDNGATSQKPKSVIDKIKLMYQTKNANIHRGVHYLSGQATMEYEQARESVRSFIGAKSLKEIIFTSGATQSINLVASSWGDKYVGAGDRVIVSEMEHHSNIVPWQLLCERKGAELKVIPFNDKGELDMDVYSDLLSDNTRIVAITGASNVLGTIPDIKHITALAHNIGAKVLVDGCQLTVHRRVDVKDIDCDFYAFSAHKLYGPTGIGVLYAKESILENMPPYMGGGDMVASVSFEKTIYAELPLKFEAGTANYIGAIGLSAAIDYIESIDFNEAMKYEHDLLMYATDTLSGIDGLRIYGTAESKCSIISFNIEGVHSLDLGMILDKQGVAIRTGTHCTEPIMQHYGVTGMARASFAMYNTFEEIDMLNKAINRALLILR